MIERSNCGCKMRLFHKRSIRGVLAMNAGRCKKIKFFPDMNPMSGYAYKKEV